MSHVASFRTRLQPDTASALYFIVWALGFACQARADDEATEFFEKQVRPILVARCYACHSGDKASGGLSLETRAGWQRGGESGTAIVPGKPDESLLIEAINYRALEMPPRDKGSKLSEAEIAVLTTWVARGAFDPREENARIAGMIVEQARRWWSFQPLPSADEKFAMICELDAVVAHLYGLEERHLTHIFETFHEAWR